MAAVSLLTQGAEGSLLKNKLYMHEQIANMEVEAKKKKKIQRIMIDSVSA